MLEWTALFHWLKYVFDVLGLTLPAGRKRCIVHLRRNVLAYFIPSGCVLFVLADIFFFCYPKSKNGGLR